MRRVTRAASVSILRSLARTDVLGCPGSFMRGGPASVRDGSWSGSRKQQQPGSPSGGSFVSREKQQPGSPSGGSFVSREKPQPGSPSGGSFVSRENETMAQFLEDVPENDTKRGVLLLKRIGAKPQESQYVARMFYLCNEALYWSKIGSKKALDCIRLDDLLEVLDPKPFNSPTHSHARMQVGQSRARMQDAIDDAAPADRPGTATPEQDSASRLGHMSPRSMRLQEEINVVRRYDTSRTADGARSSGAHSPPLETLWAVDVFTDQASSHAGRVITIACISESEALEWVASVRASKATSVLEHEKAGGVIAYWVHEWAQIYEGTCFQSAMAFIIVLNFVANVAEAEVCPGTGQCEVFEVMDAWMRACVRVHAVLWRGSHVATW